MAFLFVVPLSRGGAAGEALKSLVDKIKQEDATYSEVRTLHDQLRAGYSNTEQAAVGDAAYAWYLAGLPKPRKIAEIKDILQTLRTRGESKWYVAYTRLALISAYGREGRNIEAKTAAQEAVQGINLSDLRQSYWQLRPILGAAFGEDQFTGGEGDLDQWMAAFQSMANN